MSLRGETSGGGAGSPEWGGIYHLSIEFKADKYQRDPKPIAISTESIQEFVIEMDLNNLVPSFRFSFNDWPGVLTHVVPFDHNMSKMYVRLGKSIENGIDLTNDWDFDVYQRTPNSDGTYEISGLLAVEGLFTPDRVRSFSTAELALLTIASEIGTTDVDISPSTNVQRAVLQPTWTNGEFLLWLEKNFLGKSKEIGFFANIFPKNTVKSFMFQSLRELMSRGVKYKFGFGMDAPYKVEGDNPKDSEVIYPIMDYDIVDDYKTIGSMGARKQVYTYFDWDSDEFTAKAYDLQGNSDRTYDYMSLAEFHLIDEQDSEESNISYEGSGTTNDFHGTFEGKALGVFHKYVSNLSKIWITTIGLYDIYPGDIVEISSTGGPIGFDIPNPSYGGYWMVHKVRHMIRGVYFTRLLLTRSGIMNSEKNNRLLMATRRKTI
jgi:hypothetical protein